MYKKNIFFRWIIILTQPVGLPWVEFSLRSIIRVKIDSNVRIGARIFVIPSSPDAIFLVVSRRYTILDGFLDRALWLPVDTKNSEEQCGEQVHLRRHEHLATEELRRNRGDIRTDRVHGDSSSVIVQLPPFSPIDVRYTIRGLLDDWEERWTSLKLRIINYERRNDKWGQGFKIEINCTYDLSGIFEDEDFWKLLINIL